MASFPYFNCLVVPSTYGYERIAYRDAVPLKYEKLAGKYP